MVFQKEIQYKSADMAVDLADLYLLRKVEDSRHSFRGQLFKMLKTLEKSPTSKFLLKACAKHHVKISEDSLLPQGTSFFYDWHNRFDVPIQSKAFKDSDKALGEYIIALVSGLRRAWHHHFGNALKIDLLPKSFLKYYRFLEADVETVTLLVCWELRLAGVMAPWRQYISGKSGDMAMVFSHCVDTQPKSKFNGSALRVTFDHWFSNAERSTLVDHEALEILDMLLLDHKKANLIGCRGLLTEDLQSIGRLGNQSNYLKNNDFHGSSFNGLQDDFNQAHLRHIMIDLQYVKEKTI